MKTMKRPAKYHPNPKYWDELRKQVFAQWNNQCATIAHHTAYQLHHRHYDSWGNEKPEDVIPLCEQCHDAITSIQREERDANDPYPKHFDPIRNEPPKSNKLEVQKQTNEEIIDYELQYIPSGNWRGYLANAQFTDSRSAESIRETTEKISKKED